MAVTRGALTAQVLRRLGDVAQQVWTAEEIDGYLQTAQRELGLLTRAVWDVTYAENLPNGFSMTAAWEADYAPFDYGWANHTMADDEADAIAALSLPACLSGNHTSPFEATDRHLSDAGAATTIPAVSELPEDLTEIDRGTWDRRTLTAMNLRDVQRRDTRYRVTAGEVYGFLWQQDGVRTLRKVRVPSAQAQTYTVTGSWGILRKATDISADTPSGTWGVPRRIPTMHPMGAWHFGLPRRPYHDGLNVKLEHWREPRALETPDALCELPDRYTIALRDYALGKALARQSAGQDRRMAALFEQRWGRAIARLQRRVNALTNDRIGRMGGGVPGLGGPPPLAKLPWNFPQRTR